MPGRGFTWSLPLLAVLQVAVRCGVAASESPDFGVSVDLRGLSVHALGNNPEIKAGEQRWRAAQTRPSQEGSLPDPMLNSGYHNESFNQFTLGSSDFAWLRVGAEQEVPFPGKLGLKEAAASRAADREGALYRATVLSVLTRVRLAYDDYDLASKTINVLLASKDLLEEVTRSAEARYRVGEGLQQDVTRAQLEQSIVVGRLITADQSRQSAATMLNALLNRPAEASLGVPAPVDKPRLPYSIDEFEALAKGQSPQMKAAALEVARAESNLALAKRQFYPDFVLRADYFSKAGLVPEWEVGAGIRVPLYFSRKQVPGMQEAAAGLGEARAASQATNQDVAAKLRDLYAQATSAARLVELYGGVIGPQAELSLEASSAAYRVGKVDFLSVLNNFTTLNDYRLRYDEELANFDRALARLNEAAGVMPELDVEGVTR